MKKKYHIYISNIFFFNIYITIKSINRIRYDLTWDYLMEETYSYQLSKGNNLGGLAKCRGCKIQLQRHQPRIITRAYYQRNNGNFRKFQV